MRDALSAPASPDARDTPRPASREGAGLLLVVGACILWGTSATLARYTMGRDVPPLVVVELRLMLSVIALAVAFALIRPRLFRIARADVVPLLILGIVGIAAVQGTYYTNVSWVGVGLAILLQYLRSEERRVGKEGRDRG